MGLFGMMARTAVVAGTATAVSNRVSRRQATKWQQKADAEAAEQQQAPPQDEQAPPPAPEPAAADSSSLADELQKLATLKEQGILSDDEFAAAKNKLLGI
jgi:hypothetical protein